MVVQAVTINNVTRVMSVRRGNVRRGIHHSMIKGQFVRQTGGETAKFKMKISTRLVMRLFFVHVGTGKVERDNRTIGDDRNCS